MKQRVCIGTHRRWTADRQYFTWLTIIERRGEGGEREVRCHTEKEKKCCFWNLMIRVLRGSRLKWKVGKHEKCINFWCESRRWRWWCVNNKKRLKKKYKLLLFLFFCSVLNHCFTKQHILLKCSYHKIKIINKS